MTHAGNILEIFSSFQGEGPHAGCRQVFVRFAGCNMRCCYCDTPESWQFSKTCRVERDERVDILDNPLSIGTLLDIVKQYLNRSPHHSISITGGEPLLQTEFLAEFLPQLKTCYLPIYFETNGTMADRLAQIVDCIDIAAIDIKLPSCPGVTMAWEDTRRCVALSMERAGETIVKIIVREEDDDADLRKAAEIVGDLRRNGVSKRLPTIVIQPVTPFGESGQPPSWSRLKELRALFDGSGIETHIIPQLHKIAGWK